MLYDAQGNPVGTTALIDEMDRQREEMSEADIEAMVQRQVKQMGDKVEFPAMIYEFTLLDSERKVIDTFEMQSVFADEILFLRMEDQAEIEKLDHTSLEEMAKRIKKCIVIIPKDAEFMEAKHIGFAEVEEKNGEETGAEVVEETVGAADKN